MRDSVLSGVIALTAVVAGPSAAEARTHPHIAVTYVPGTKLTIAEWNARLEPHRPASVQAFLLTSIPKEEWLGSDGRTVLKVVNLQTGAVLYQAPKGVQVHAHRPAQPPSFIYLPER